MASKKPTKKVKAAAKKASETIKKNTENFVPSMDFSMFGKAFPQFKPFSMETNMFKGNKQLEKMTQDAAVMGQDQMEAVVKASTIFAKGMEDIIKTCMEIAQEAGEKSQNAAKTMMACKTLNEFTDVQTRMAQASFDEFMTNSTRLSEKAVKLMTDAMEPINDQMGKSIKRASDTMAA